MLACEACGFKSSLIRFDTNVTEEALLAEVERLNNDDDVDGFIVQLPLPKKPSYEFICGLMRHYPNLNIEWLMFGKGKMYKDTSIQSGDLFTEDPELYSEPVDLPKEEKFDLLEQVITNQQPQIEIKTLVKEVQKPVAQRKIIKVMAFFDDGTFQELHSI